MAIDHQVGRSIVGKVIESAPSVLFSAVVYGVPIVYTAGIVAELVFTTFFKQTKRGRPSVSKPLDKPESNPARAQGGTCGAF
ncbi:uncharacterized protein LOC123467382 [Daphnia magna]|uniref:Uncharacterized protein n=3 Tax=Daphnia TaxID=6668 RepID=A0ABQ9ZHX3_9CRUS|nr:uncharacterized protein LOC116934389 [Daphnia magna]XP_045023273.1 uncharacterized protein LOC123467382 [Daphnia magna]KAI9558308.1 hypothetical protein GHT06_015061 [Daphnia sinensis]KAK4012160.1 hypothetical protein OUZ56_021259 [Daphnia magna]KZS03421.1 Uncharacterized protein APZ42_033872 [Daphnia magna]